ncbi:MAG: rhodanese-like domain-containing protein [Dehalococcoidia bacterium]
MAYGRQEPSEPYRRISVQEAFELQQQGALIVDVRRPDEWTSGHAKGAIHIPVDDFLARAETELPKDKDLLFICAMGARSGLAAEMAAALEFDAAHLYNIEEGTPVWIQAKLPTETGQ